MVVEVEHNTGAVLDGIVAKSLDRRGLTRDEARWVLASSDDVLLDVVAGAAKVRRKYFANRIKGNFLINMKSGLCPEDCSYCSQRRGSDAEILKYFWLDPEQAASVAHQAIAGGAARICLVASGRGPSANDLARVQATVGAIKAEHPDIEICVSLGLMSAAQASDLADAGVFAYNHNLNTAESHYGEICTTHTFADRVATVAEAKLGGLSPCSGAIFGMGESDEEIIDVAFALSELEPDSVPINFLLPFDGTPLAGHFELNPQRCLRILSLFRFVFPDVEVRIAAGREVHLRTLQPLALHVANSLFLGDYLTSEGQAASDDLKMIKDNGFVLEGQDEDAAVETTHVAIRRRGPGSDAPANL